MITWQSALNMQTTTPCFGSRFYSNSNRIVAAYSIRYSIRTEISDSQVPTCNLPIANPVLYHQTATSAP